MSGTVLEKLHSAASFVAIEAAAGCGKTRTAATFATECAAQLQNGHVLLLSHTHAACGEFQRRCGAVSKRIDVETCDSFALKVVSPYAGPLGLPRPLDEHVGASDAAMPFAVLSQKAVELLNRSPTVAKSVARSYPVIVLDEHQDSSAAQHEMIAILCRYGVRVRAFGDPMQAIHPDGDGGYVDWTAVVSAADASDTLDVPWRWRDSKELGAWIATARLTLKSGNPIDLSSVPGAVRVHTHTELAGRERFSDPQAIAQMLREGSDHAERETVAVLAFLGRMVRSIAIAGAWRPRVNEGATLEHLDRLLDLVRHNHGDPGRLSSGFLDFVGEVCTGLTGAMKQGLQQRLGAEIDVHRAGPLQLGWLRCLQPIYDCPDHRGLAKAMLTFKSQRPKGILIRLRDHVWALCALSDIHDPQAHLRVLGRVRRRRRAGAFTASTIHKAKGLEFSRVILCPVDRHQYPAGSFGARLLYVALSRASVSLDIVVNGKAPCSHVVGC